jgi:hypothetical protein
MCIVTSDANSSYQSLQAKLTKRFSKSMTFLAAYTLAKSMDDNEGDEGFTGGVGNNNAQNDNNQRADKARSYNDARQRLVMSYVWDLPFGSGRAMLNGGGLANKIFGGWTLSGITSFQTGLPFSVRSQDYSNTGSTNPRPDRICNGKGPQTVDQWYDTSCFTVTLLQQALASGAPRFGNAGRNVLDGPKFINWDIALLKNIPIHERFILDFRSEFYNAFNTPHFGPPRSRIESLNAATLTNAGEPRDIQFGLKLQF